MTELGYSQVQLALLVVAISAGSLIASHVNDGGFWIISRYFGISVADTLKTWTALETILSVSGFAVAALLMAIVQGVSSMAELGRRTFLGAVGAVGIGSLLATPTAAARSRTVFIGSYSDDGLVVASRSSGPALSVGGTAPVPSASWLAISGDTLYSTNEVDAGTVTALSLRDLTVLGSQSTLGAAPTHLAVHPSRRYLLTANYTSGTVVVHPILPGGALGEATDLVKHTGAERDAHAHQVVTDPSGRWVLSVDLGADSVYVYQLGLATGKLTLHQQVLLPSGAGPRHLAFHPNGRVAYLLGELTPVVTVADWDPVCGALTLGQVVSTVPDSSPGPNYPGEIGVSADGRFVYATVRGENTLASFSSGRGGRELTRLGENVPTGDWPRHFALDPSERWFYVSNQRSGMVTWHPRDPATGLPSPAFGSLPLPSVATVLFR